MSCCKPKRAASIVRMDDEDCSVLAFGRARLRMRKQNSANEGDRSLCDHSTRIKFCGLPYGKAIDVSHFIPLLRVSGLTGSPECPPSETWLPNLNIHETNQTTLTQEITVGVGGLAIEQYFVFALKITGSMPPHDRIVDVAPSSTQHPAPPCTPQQQKGQADDDRLLHSASDSARTLGNSVRELESRNMESCHSDARVRTEVLSFLSGRLRLLDTAPSVSMRVMNDDVHTCCSTRAGDVGLKRSSSGRVVQILALDTAYSEYSLTTATCCSTTLLINAAQARRPIEPTAVPESRDTTTTTPNGRTCRVVCPMRQIFTNRFVLGHNPIPLYHDVIESSAGAQQMLPSSYPQQKQKQKQKQQRGAPSSSQTRFPRPPQSVLDTLDHRAQKESETHQHQFPGAPHNVTTTLPPFSLARMHAKCKRLPLLEPLSARLPSSSDSATTQGLTIKKDASPVQHMSAESLKSINSSLQASTPHHIRFFAPAIRKPSLAPVIRFCVA
ncbi:uncharacterized protein PAC_16033 [Phialocephala subalpina]|uniref:Uncharacterized protein n=1 Tax=Phialocephala subalpina TaxID=576137 RepID=A0A1L7XM72_9HELO|nr:uncharacterized protein PAC_16033 [Phialocephala subalpina]